MPPQSGPGDAVLKPTASAGLMSGSPSPWDPESLEAALEAGCATLVALQRLRLSSAEDPARTDRLTRDIDSVRRGIAELRSTLAKAANPLDYGFVLAAVSATGVPG